MYIASANHSQKLVLAAAGRACQQWQGLPAVPAPVEVAEKPVVELIPGLQQSRFEPFESAPNSSFRWFLSNSYFDRIELTTLLAVIQQKI